MDKVSCFCIKCFTVVQSLVLFSKQLRPLRWPPKRRFCQFHFDGVLLLR